MDNFERRALKVDKLLGLSTKSCPQSLVEFYVNIQIFKKVIHNLSNIIGYNSQNRSFSAFFDELIKKVIHNFNFFVSTYKLCKTKINECPK